MDSIQFHRAAVVVQKEGGYYFETQQLQRPSPLAHEVLVKLSATGVCGTDISLASGELGPCRQILGHEGIGRVVEIGSGVPPREIELGQRVGVAWQRDICGHCEYCLVDGGETRCAMKIQSGRAVDGTFAEYTVVPARYLLRLPEGLPDEYLAPILCGGVTIYKALKICGAQAGKWIGISGAGGGVGALGIQYAKGMGFQVVAVDIGDDKRSLCLGAGADIYVDVGNARTDAISQIFSATNSKGVAAMLVTAGSGRAYQDAMGMLAPFGTLVCIGIPPPSGTFTLHPLQFIDHSFRVIGSAVGSRGDILEAIDFVRRGVVKPAVILIGLSDIQEATMDFKKGKVFGKYVVKFDQ